MEIKETKASEAYNNAYLLNEFRPEVYHKTKVYLMNTMMETGQLDEYGFGFLNGVLEITKEQQSIDNDQIDHIEKTLDRAYENYIDISGEERVLVGNRYYQKILNEEANNQRIDKSNDRDKNQGMSL